MHKPPCFLIGGPVDSYPRGGEIILVSHETTDAIEEFAAQKLIIERFPARTVVFAAAKAFPEATGLTISFAMCCVASIVEANKSNAFEAPKRLSEEIYKAVAVLSADLFEISLQGIPEALGRDLLRHWFITQDRYFATA
jgi:hypothetical protein